MARNIALRDPRWDAIAATLSGLRQRRRRAVRIVDADCGCGTLLLAALTHARALGFTAIEGRGLDRSPMRIGRARRAAMRLRDPAIGVTFDAGDALGALVDEVDVPADILLCHTAVPGSMMAAAGDVVIDDPIPSGQGAE